MMPMTFYLTRSDRIGTCGFCFSSMLALELAELPRTGRRGSDHSSMDRGGPTPPTGHAVLTFQGTERNAGGFPIRRAWVQSALRKKKKTKKTPRLRPRELSCDWNLSPDRAGLNLDQFHMFVFVIHMLFSSLEEGGPVVDGYNRTKRRSIFGSLRCLKSCCWLGAAVPLLLAWVLFPPFHLLVQLLFLLFTCLFLPGIKASTAHRRIGEWPP